MATAANYLSQIAANLKAIPDTPEYAPLKGGLYEVTIARATFKPTKRGDGMILSVGFTTENNSWLWANLNLVNPSAQAQEIGTRQFAELLRAVGIPATKFKKEDDFTAQLEGCELVVRVGINPDNTNSVRGFQPKQ